MEMQKRAEFSVPLLKHIKDCKTMFKIPFKKIKEEIQILSNNKSFEEFEQTMEELKSRTKNNVKFKIELINKMIDLVKEASHYQYELNKMLKPYYIIATNIKLKGKKFFNENIKLFDHARITKFVGIFARPEYVHAASFEIQLSELMYLIDIMEKQSYLVNEYKKGLIKGIEEYNKINRFELEIYINKFTQVSKEINAFQEFAQNNFDYLRYNKETVNQIFKDLKKAVDKFKEYQNGIFYYQEILDLFNKVRDLSSKFCYEEFNLKVELICEFNL
jgi:hypothetical protein